MRQKCAIQQAIYLLKVMFRLIQLLAITGQRCNDDFMLSLSIYLLILPHALTDILGRCAVKQEKTEN